MFATQSWPMFAGIKMMNHVIAIVVAQEIDDTADKIARRIDLGISVTAIMSNKHFKIQEFVEKKRYYYYYYYYYCINWSIFKVTMQSFAIMCGMRIQTKKRSGALSENNKFRKISKQ